MQLVVFAKVCCIYLRVTCNFMKQLFKITLTIFLLTISFQLFAQIQKPSATDSTSYFEKTIIIQGKRYLGFLNHNGFYLVDSKNEIYLSQSGEYFTWDFKDFNNDGYDDIFLSLNSNTPDVFNLLLYLPKTHSFKFIQDFNHFSAPEQIHETNYFYSYHESGCADMDWDSDLFYINKYKAIRIGNISGNQCENSGIKDGLYIYKVHDEKKTLIKTLSIDIIKKYKDYKWDFIKEYWNKNYKLFL